MLEPFTRPSTTPNASVSAIYLSVVIPVFNEEQNLSQLFARLYPVLNIAASVRGDDVCYVDGVMLVEGYNIEYFDGDTLDGTYRSDLTYEWEGTPHASRSVMREPTEDDLRGDLYKTKVDGIHRALPNTRLNKSPINGLYRME